VQLCAPAVGRRAKQARGSYGGYLKSALNPSRDQKVSPATPPRAITYDSSCPTPSLPESDETR